MFFQAAAKRYGWDGTTLTSNVSLGRGAKPLSAVLTGAMLDRLLHHASVVTITGESYRLKDKRRAGLVARPVREPAVPA